MQKVALVTGASRGIGRAIAAALAAAGWRIAINYRANRHAAGETLDRIRAAGGTAEVFQADIGLAADRERLLQEVSAKMGAIAVLVNNAGIAPQQRTDLLQTTEASYDEVMRTNLKGPFFLTQVAARQMIELVKKGFIANPKIINIGSISADVVSINRPEYCLSKAGMAMMTRLFAARLAEFGIQVFEIQPGIIETDMTVPVKAQYTKKLAKGLAPMRRIGTPEDVAQAVIAIVEGRFPYSTGEIIHVDGGIRLRQL